MRISTELVAIWNGTDIQVAWKASLVLWWNRDPLETRHHGAKRRLEIGIAYMSCIPRRECSLKELRV